MREARTGWHMDYQCLHIMIQGIALLISGKWQVTSSHLLELELVNRHTALDPMAVTQTGGLCSKHKGRILEHSRYVREHQKNSLDLPSLSLQACDTCRSRKAKCDEGKPMCGYCRDNNQHCRYKEVAPPK